MWGCGSKRTGRVDFALSGEEKKALLSDQQTVDVEALRRLHVVLLDIAGGQPLDVAMRSVTTAVADVTRFGVVAAYVVGEDIEVVAVTGSEEARTQLEGQRYRREVFERLLEAGEPWGELRFHRDPRALLERENTEYWIGESDLPARTPYADASAGSPLDREGAAVGDVDDPRGPWDPSSVLLAPLRSARGHLIGLLGVDQPLDGRLPSHTQCELLEIFATQTGLALDNRQLVTDLVAEHDRLRANATTLRRVFGSAPIGMWTTALEEPTRGQITQVNDAMCRLFGYTAEEFTDLRIDDLTEAESDPELGDRLRQVAEGGLESDRIETTCVRRDGGIFWGQIHLAAISPDSGHGPPSHLIAQIVDISARKASEHELAHRAAHDPLTGLLNRTVIAERLQLVLSSERDARRPGAILFCDLDHFKVINDRHGHQAGDEVLAGVGRRIGNVVRRSDSVGRYGGDEFLVLVPEISADEARQMAIRLVDAVNEPFMVEGEESSVGVSVGVVMLRVDGSSAAEEVLAVADEAMYHAKSASGPERFVVREL